MGANQPEKKKNQVTPAGFIVGLIILVGFAGCTVMGGSSGHGKAKDAGISISYGDYHDMCDVYSGEIVRGMDIDRTWTSAQDSELRSIIANDSSCQPERE